MTARFACYPSLDARTVLITGGACGIGARMVARFAEQKARVAFLDFDDSGGREVAAATGATFVHCDLRDIAALRAAVVRVAEADGGEVVGYAYGRLEGRDWNALRDPCALLYDVWVDDAHRRSGAGLLLCEAMKEAFGALGAPRVILMSATSNETAQRLFVKVGFRYTMAEMTCELD